MNTNSHHRSIGFTGTSGSVTKFQASALKRILRSLYNDNPKSQQFHHGDCIGADNLAHDYATEIGFQTHVHPPINPYKRAFVVGDIKYLEKEYLKRNQDIVNSCKILVACPKEPLEMLRSGTWATIRRCQKAKKPYIIILPNGNATYGDI